MIKSADGGKSPPWRKPACLPEAAAVFRTPPSAGAAAPATPPPWNSANIKLVIFDMGGVVVQNASVSGAIAAHYGLSEEAFFRGAGAEPDAGAADTSPYNLGDTGALMRGLIDSAGFWRAFTARTGIPVSGDPWYDFFKPVRDEKTVAVIESLKAAGKRVVCGTNTIAVHYRKHQERGDYTAFHAVYASHEMGAIKPDAAFWRYIMERESVQPSETLFIDDMEENTRAAAALGLSVHLFTGAEGLKGALDASVLQENAV